MSNSKEKKLVYDPLTEILNHYSGKKKEVKVSIEESLPVDEQLKRHIIHGEKQELENHLRKAMETYSPLDIINQILLDGMRVVGELFAKGEMQLPFVLQSAEVMKAAVAFLEPFMEKNTGTTTKGTLVLATVKGDVHDIGKNLVDIILSNNGFRVINLGIKCPVETMLRAVEEHHADAIGMSGLLVKSTLIMKENLEVMQERNLTIPVLLGGAALTKRYVNEELRNAYQGPVYYCEDAFSGLRVMEELAVKTLKPELPDPDHLEQPAGNLRELTKRWKIVRHHWSNLFSYFPDDAFLHEKLNYGRTLESLIRERIEKEFTVLNNLSQKDHRMTENETANTIPLSGASYATKSDALDAWNAIHQVLLQILNKPEVSLWAESDQEFWRKLSEELYCPEYALWKSIHSYLNLSVKTGTSSLNLPRRSPKIKPAERIPVPPFYGSRIIENIPLDNVYPLINEIALFRGQWQFVKGNRSETDYQQLIEKEARPVFEKWKARAKAEQLLQPKVIYGYFPCQSDGDDLIIWREDFKSEWLRFTFPRQADEPYLCISDFFSDVHSGIMDVVGCHLVTVGSRASEFAMELFSQNAYADYLYFHGLSVETAEALAEYWHREIRKELGIAQDDSDNIKKLFQQHYQGSRYSFGYPACPNLEDQTKIFELLRPERIGVTLSEGFQLHPEQSTSAIIVHHPQAKYFNVR